MKLLYPEFLWALFAISIPILIHLFNFRKFQRVYFSNIDLLKEVQLETKSKSKLKHLVILTLRILAIAALVFAFCQPYIPTNNSEQKGDGVISIFIDNSNSMDSKGTNGYRLELAKEQANAIINSYGPTDQFQVITNDFEGRHQRLYNKTEATQLVDEIAPTYLSKKLSEVYLRQQDLLQPLEDVNKTVYWLSDFQKQAADFEQIPADSSMQIACIPYFNDGKSNVYIDSIWFETPVRKAGSEDLLFAKIVNSTASVIDFKLNLNVNGENRAFVNFNAEAQSATLCKIPYSIYGNGLQHCTLTIEDYPDADLTFDDVYYFTYSVTPNIQIANLYQGENLSDTSGYFGVLFGRDPQFKLQNISLGSFDFSTLGQYDLVILSNLDVFSSGFQSEFEEYLSKGGSLCIFPSKTANISSYNEFFSKISELSLAPKSLETTKVSKLFSEHPIYQDIFDQIPDNVDLPSVIEYFSIDAAISSGSEKLMTLQNGKPFLLMTKSGKGNLVICAAPLDPSSSNFVKHALFVPTMLRVAEFSQYRSKYYYTIGADNAVNTISSLKQGTSLEVFYSDNSFSFLPELKVTKNETVLLLFDQIKKAGHYDVRSENNLLDGFSFNDDRRESLQDFFIEAELKEALANSEIGIQTKVLDNADSVAGVQLQEIVKGKKYWWHLIVIALLLLGAEIAVFRLMS